MSNFLYSKDVKTGSVADAYMAMHKVNAEKAAHTAAVNQVRVALHEQADDIIAQFVSKCQSVNDSEKNELAKIDNGDTKAVAVDMSALPVQQSVCTADMQPVAGIVRSMMDGLLYAISNSEQGDVNPEQYAASAKALFNDPRLSDVCKAICSIYADAKNKAK